MVCTGIITHGKENHAIKINNNMRNIYQFKDSMMQDGNVIPRKERDEVAERTLSCTHRNMAHVGAQWQLWGIACNPIVLAKY